MMESFSGLGILRGSGLGFFLPVQSFLHGGNGNWGYLGCLLTAVVLVGHFSSSVLCPPPPHGFPSEFCVQGPECHWLALLFCVGRRAGRVTSLAWIMITCTGVNFFDPLMAGFACFPHPAPSFRTLEFMAHSVWRPLIPDLLLGSPLGLVLFPCCR